MNASSKAANRAGNRSFTRDGKHHPAELRAGRPAEPVLARAAAPFRNRSWRRPTDVKPSHVLLSGATWETCPACAQQASEEYLGRIRIAADGLGVDEGALRRRIRNVAARAEATQPERRIVSIERSADGLEVLTTSQKLAHRIVHELKKAFGGRADYRWSDDGMLEARFRGRAPAAPRAR